MSVSGAVVEEPSPQRETSKRSEMTEDHLELTDAEKLARIDTLDPNKEEDKARLRAAMIINNLKEMDEQGTLKPKDAYARKQWQLEEVDRELKRIASAHKALGEEPWHGKIKHFFKGTRGKLNNEFATWSATHGIIMRDLESMRREIEL
jgi:hypothetical protein